MPRCSSAYRAARGKSLPTTPTTCTGWRMDPATLKNTAEPPSASAVSPNGVATESRATDPTTRSDTLHPVRGADAHEREAVRQHLAHGARQHEPRRLLRQKGRLRPVQRREIHAVRGGGLGRATGHTEDAAQARVRHLHVEDGVLFGLALGEVHVEHEM